jgi:hypothetical protein
LSNVELPNDGRVKEGGWGAESKPKTWTITSMKDEPTLFKVIDKNNVNVADSFHTQDNAQQFIDFHKSREDECEEGKVYNYLKKQCEGISAIGKTIYKTTGKKANNINNHDQGITCSGHHANSRRGDCDVDFINQEATVTVQFTTDCKCGDELTIKHWGPGHSDGNCCWEIGCVNQSGEVGRMGEGPHPVTTSPKPTTNKSNIGSVKGAKIGVKSIVWKTSDDPVKGHHEMWVDKTATGNWQKAAEWDFANWGAEGFSSHGEDGRNTNKIAPTNKLTVEFRCDCDDAQFTDLSVDEIVPGVMA